MSCWQSLAVESTFNWYWLVDGLQDAGYPLRLVNTAAVRQYEGLKYSDDRGGCVLAGASDAPGDTADGGYLSQGATRGAQSAAPAHRTGADWGGMPDQHPEPGLAVQRCGISSGLIRKPEFAVPLPAGHVQLAARSLLSVQRALQREGEELEAAALAAARVAPSLQDFARPSPVWGRLLGMTIWLETGEITRFKSPSNGAFVLPLREQQRLQQRQEEGRRQPQNRVRITCPGRSEKQYTSTCTLMRWPAFFERKRAQTSGIVTQSGRWRTNWPAPVTACYAIRRLTMSRVCSVRIGGRDQQAMGLVKP